MATKATFVGADDAAIGRLVDDHYGAMHRLARLVARDPDTATDAVRAAWSAVVQSGAPAPPARPALLGLVLAALPPTPPAPPQPAASADDFEDPEGRWAGWWKDEQAATPPLDGDRLDLILAVIPPRLTAVLLLRDVEALDAAQVETLLGLSPDEQLALLHDGRVAVRNAARAQERP